MMTNKNYAAQITATFFAVFGLMILSGCSGGSAPISTTNSAKNGTANQAVVVNSNSVSGSENGVVNNNSSAVVPPVNSAPKAVNNAPASNKNNVAANNALTPQIGSGSSDMSLVLQIKGALSNADKNFTDSVIVDAKEGNVILTGNVASEADKAKVAQIAQGFKGVKKIQNNLRVSQ